MKDLAAKVFILLNEAEDASEAIDLDEFLEVGKKSEQDEDKTTESEFLDSTESEVIDGIRKGIAEKVSPDDYETHYDLALAYFEMELLEDAIEEFKKASYGDKKYESLYMLAECYKKLRKYDSAINIHKLILADFDDIEKIKNSLYELGSIYEEQGELAFAKLYYEKLANLDPDFRDVSKKLGAIDESKEEEEEEISSKSKKKKISFL